jgi:uncharacterized protein (TIGR00730 family)
MSKIHNVCVYCGSSTGTDPMFAEAARSLAVELVKADMGLVYGGGSHGLMGILAQSVFEAGGHVTGIIPDFLDVRERRFKEAQELIVVPDMHTRKRMMFEKADAFVALPGGIGTLEELVEQLTWVQLDRHNKPVVLADVGSFWRPLLNLFAHMRTNGFIRQDLEVRYQVAEKITDVVPILHAASEIAERAGVESAHLTSRL